MLGGLQGAVGWYMVKSGLVDRTDVSQYRLMVHFGIALLILGYTLWLLFGLGGDKRSARGRSAAWLAGFVLALIFVQMLAGALVAGLDAGMGFNTWPLINGAFVPSGLGEAEPWYLNLFENPLAVQFDHRMLGYAVVVAALLQLVWLALEARRSLRDGQRPDAWRCSPCCKPASASGPCCSPCRSRSGSPIRPVPSPCSRSRSIIFGWRGAPLAR